MREGKNGFGSYKSGKKGMFAAYAPVNGTAGWSVAVVAPKSDYLSSMYFDFGVERIVYISCKPTSLVRDLELLMRSVASVRRSVGSVWRRWLAMM